MAGGDAAADDEEGGKVAAVGNSGGDGQFGHEQD